VKPLFGYIFNLGKLKFGLKDPIVGWDICNPEKKPKKYGIICAKSPKVGTFPK
jgi:hypothetical protein